MDDLFKHLEPCVPPPSALPCDALPFFEDVKICDASIAYRIQGSVGPGGCETLRQVIGKAQGCLYGHQVRY